LPYRLATSHSINNAKLLYHIYVINQGMDKNIFVLIFISSLGKELYIFIADRQKSAKSAHKNSNFFHKLVDKLVNWWYNM